MTDSAIWSFESFTNLSTPRISFFHEFLEIIFMWSSFLSDFHKIIIRVKFSNNFLLNLSKNQFPLIKMFFTSHATLELSYWIILLISSFKRTWLFCRDKARREEGVE